MVINGTSLNWAGIAAGVPQGSVLVPFLCLVYINDQTQLCNNHCDIRIFADDTCLHITVDNKINAALLLKEDLKAIESWANLWLVDFCAPKTESMIVSKKTSNNVHPQ